MMSYIGDSSSHLQHHENSILLDDMTPKEWRSIRPSPPPSFYRRENSRSNSNTLLDDTSLPLSSPLPSYHIKEQINSFAEPPPPISNSVQFLESSRVDTASRLRVCSRNSGSDPLLILERRQKAKEAEIQLLINTQSKLLNQCYEKRTKNLSDVCYSAPAIKLLPRASCPGVIPVRQPKLKPLGLQETRKGLTRSIEELIDIKNEEVDTLENEISMRLEALKTVNAWENNMNKVKELLSDQRNVVIGDSLREFEEANQEFSELAKLKEKERAIETEVHRLEDKLTEMRAKHRWLKERIDESINRREARLSSYRGALRNTESEIKKFLEDPPISKSVVTSKCQDFNSVPPSIRTLGLAKELWTKEVSQIKLRKQKAQIEKNALQDASLMWEACIRDVSNFEDDLRKKIERKEIQDELKLKDQILKMYLVIENLEESLQVAEERGWNLLICVIGAELEAFSIGQDILKNAMEISENELRNNLSASYKNDSGVSDDFSESDGCRATRRDLEQALAEDGNESKLTSHNAS